MLERHKMVTLALQGKITQGEAARELRMSSLRFTALFWNWRLPLLTQLTGSARTEGR